MKDRCGGNSDGRAFLKATRVHERTTTQRNQFVLHTVLETTLDVWIGKPS